MEIVSKICKELESRLDNGLNDYNKKFSDTFNAVEEDFGFYAYDGDELMGGLAGKIDRGNWAYIGTLFIEDKYRNRDIGTELVKRVEEMAGEKRCVGIRVATWSFQGRGFYEKMGFKVWGELQDFPKGASLIVLAKKM